MVLRIIPRFVFVVLFFLRVAFVLSICVMFSFVVSCGAFLG